MADTVLTVEPASRVPLTNETSNENKIEGERRDDSCDDLVRKRLVCVDIIRGITMAVMVFVDMTGDAYPGIGHSTWNKVQLADFVMPFFLFTCGVSVSLALKRIEGKRVAVIRKVLWRCCMLFFVGIVIQGRWLHHTSIGLDLSNFRIMGILQRIAIAYGIAAIVKAFVPTLPSQAEAELPPNGGRSLDIWLFSRYALQWAVASLFLLAYLILMHCIAVPRAGCKAADWIDGKDFRCNVAGWVDVAIFGREHLYKHDEKYAPYGFDPEGFATTLGCIFTVYAGIHAGHAHILIGATEPWRCMRHWLAMAVAFLILAFCIMPVVPFNKHMWSVSYNFLMIGSACLMLVILRALEIMAGGSNPRDMASKASQAVGVLLTPFRWLGTNALLFFVFSDSGDVLKSLVASIYTHNKPENNLVTWFQGHVLMDGFGLRCPGWTKADPKTDRMENECSMILAYSLIEIAMWCCICGVLFRKRIFWKL